MKSTFKTILTIVAMVVTMPLSAQISQGGFPMEINRSKSKIVSNSNVVTMPQFDMAGEREYSLLKSENSGCIEKNLTFAHVFEVSLTPDNSGEWFKQDGYNVWRVEIESKEAYSLNLVFEHFKIPDGSRLFVFDENQTLILGAFTNLNNNKYDVLGVYPVPGEKVIVQYEEPFDVAFNGELEIGKVAHGYIDVFNKAANLERRNAGSCNVDVNCEAESGLADTKRAVVRILSVNELGTGTLINNIRNDGTPYVITALHVFNNIKNASVTLFDFNFESPFCLDLDGSDVQTMSGATVVAMFDSLDFMLLELLGIPPASYHPYWAGWDARGAYPHNSWCIHHPDGDTKKISHDEDKCTISSFDNAHLKNGLWKVGNWESGTTEGGSSGSALFLGSGNLVGVLEGGSASCTSNTFDLFTRFDLLFDYNTDITKQAKNWLDPDNTGEEICSGFDYYNEEKCIELSNFDTSDVAVLPAAESNGWLTGNNDDGITDIAEFFGNVESGHIAGVSIGVGVLHIMFGNRKDLVISIYEGEELPENLVDRFSFSLTRANSSDEMTYFEFPYEVEVSGPFFIGVELLSGSDSLAFYCAKNRSLLSTNTLFFLKNGEWLDCSQVVVGSSSMSLLMEANVCAVLLSEPKDENDDDNGDFEVKLYPVPTSSELTVEYKNKTANPVIHIYDVLGKEVIRQRLYNSRFEIINVDILVPGVYISKVVHNGKSYMQRIVRK